LSKPVLPPLAAIVIEPVPFVMEIPLPAVRVAAVGVPLVLPMISCPLVIAAQETTPEELVTRLAESVGFNARKVATPVPNPDTPVLIGKPVQLVNVPLEGVPRAGVVKLAEVEPTNSAVPV
jgi:hypothetical protein